MAVLSIGQVWADDPTVTIAYSGSTTTNMTGNNDAATLGLDATSWSVVGAKGSASNLPGLNKSHYIALYYNANGSNTLTVTNTAGATITSITIAYSGTYNNGVVKVGGNTVAISDGAYPINASSFEITNGNTSNVQVRITSIVITYSGGTTPAVLQSIAVTGTPTTTSYEAGVAFDPAGLVVTGTYDVGDPAAITSGITWTACKTESGTYVALNDEAVALAKDETGIYVKATVGEITSPAFPVTGLTVTAAQPKITIDGSADGITTTDEAQTITAGVGSFGGMFKQYSTTALWFTKGSGYIYNTASFGYIRKITINYKSGGAGDAYQWIKMGNSVMNSYEAASTNGVKYESSTGGSSNTFVVDGDYEYFCLSVSNKNLQASSIVIEYDNTPSAPKAATPTFPTGDENFVTSTSVTLACTTEGASIYYTTNGDVPTSSSTLYNGAILVSATTTIKAIAVADGMDNSNVAQKTFTKVTALTTMAEVQAQAEADEKAINVVISNWVVTAANSSQAWIADADNAKGILLYKNSHGLTAGKKLNGTVVGTKIKLYNLYPELTSLVASDVTVTDAEAVSPRSVTIPTLNSNHPAEQGTLVKLDNVTYTSSMLSDGVNTIAADNKFYNSLALVEGTTYNITGVVTYYKSGDDPVVKIAPRSAADVEAQSPVVIPTAANLAALKAAERGTYILTLSNAVVTYVNGNNAFIEDATGGALIYFASHGYSAGDCLNGDYQVVTTDYQGKFEITAMEPQAGAATTTADVPLTTISIATLNANFASYESRRIKIEGANVTDAISGSDRNGAISDGAALAVYAAVASTITLTQNDNVDIIGYPGFHNTDQQLTVWAQADITVNVKEDPELSYSPATLTIEEGDAWSAPTFNNPHSLAIASYVSSNEAVATVSDGGEIALAGGIGTAVITAHTNGDATYAAGNATYTITVNEAGSYSMSFDFTRASYDDAADEEVVWNSSVATITATKGTGTKVTNYLAGNYSGTTLIAETRLYANNSLGFEAKTGASITKVEVTMTGSTYASALAGYVWTNASAEVSSTNNKVVVITPTAATFSAALTGQIRIAQVAVYYTAESEKSKLAASISIANMNMAVGDEDILLSEVEAISNPNKKAISYEVTSGSEYISITGEGAAAAFHAIAEGTATISATIPDNLGNYTGATTTFNIVVAAAAPTLQSIAISGDASVLEYTAGQHFDPTGLVVTGTYSDASTAPISEGIDWTFDPDPLTEGTTSVSVTATVESINSPAFVVNGLTVSAAPAPTSGNVVILAEYNSKFYAMTNSLTSSALAGVEVEKDGSNIVVASQDDKDAIQWTATVDGDNTTLKDADDYYIKGSSSASLSLDAAPFNWTWDSEKSCYINSETTSRGLFFSSNGNVFKGYAISNISDAAYAAIEVIEIDPANIVISSKVDPELAYTPASDEITVGDAWSAPALGYVDGFDGLAAVTYASNNEAVATVSDAGVIALAGGTGTATITATFTGNANYLAGSATYTIKVNEVAESCDGSDDFSTATTTNPSSYIERTTDNGWSSVNAALITINDDKYLTINGKTTAVGVITSPVLSDGIASLKIRYANTFSESNGVSFRVDIKQGEDIVKTYTVTKANSEVTQGTVYTEVIENINVAGDFQIIFTNLSPSNNTGNKDRLSIGRLCWENYTAPEPPTKDLVRGDLSKGKWGTICPKQTVENVEGAVFYQISYLEEKNGLPYNMVWDEIEGTTLTAGKPYFFIANATEIRGNKTGAVLDEAGEAVNGFYGYIGDDELALTDWHTNYDPAEDNTFVIYNNKVTRINGATNLLSERCYIKINSTVPSRTAVPKNNARHRISMGVAGINNAATDVDNIDASETPRKMMIDGTMYILRGEKMYDATGRLVK